MDKLKVYIKERFSESIELINSIESLVGGYVHINVPETRHIKYKHKKYHYTLNDIIDFLDIFEINELEDSITTNDFYSNFAYHITEKYTFRYDDSITICEHKAYSSNWHNLYLLKKVD